MSDSVKQHLQTLMRESFTVDNLKNVDADEFQKNILDRIDKDDSEIEGYFDPSKQRDISIRYFWGHNHDFGTFYQSGPMGDRHIDIIAQFVADYGLPLDLTGKKVLDIGVWTGGTCLLLTAMGAEVTGCEEVKKYADTVNYLAHAFGLDTLTCERLSLYEIDFQDSFDYVIYSGVIYHVTDPILSLRILYNALKDGGDIFVETFGIWAGGEMQSVCLVESGPMEGNAESLNRTGWNNFIPSSEALKSWMISVGFKDVNVGAPTQDLRRIHGKGMRVQHEDMLRAGLSRPDIR